MKRLWNIIGFMAIVNLIAILVVVAWLWQSQRIDRDRVEKVRALLSISIPDELAAADEQAKKDAEGKAAEEAAARLRNPPVTSAAQVTALNQLEREVAQGLRRLQDEKRQLSAALDTRERAIKQREDEFASERLAWEQSIKDQRAAQTDQQFAKAVKLIESLPAKQGKEKLVTMVNQGGTDQAVMYLNAMSPRAAGKILKEFKSAEETRLATDLLERLRKLGRMVPPDEVAPDAVSPNDANAPAGSTAAQPAG
jgi:hypothetical protein